MVENEVPCFSEIWSSPVVSIQAFTSNSPETSATPLSLLTSTSKFTFLPCPSLSEAASLKTYLWDPSGFLP